MPIIRWGIHGDPFAGLDWLRSQMNRLMEPSRWGDSRRIGGGRFPPVNVYNGAEEMIVLAEVPGVALEDLDLSITGDTLVLKGVKKADIEAEPAAYDRRERGAGEFHRVIILPDRVDPDAVTARLTDGILTITLGKSEAAKPRQISVER